MKADSQPILPPSHAGYRRRDEFLSEEDLDLKNLTEAELITYWNLWLKQAQATNDLDANTYSHGVFTKCPRY
jgi:hypothetical protein